MYYDRIENICDPVSAGWNHRRNLVTTLVQRADLKEEFSHITTDKERFAYSLSKLLQYDTSRWFDPESEQKTTEESIRWRRDGNESFKHRRYLKSLQDYTMSVLHAVPLSEELAVAYANRSAVLFEMKRHKDCIKDIDRAMNLKYPDRLKAKLYRRKGLSLARLGDCRATFYFREALVWLDKTTLSENEINILRDDLHSLIAAPYIRAKPSVKLEQYLVPEIRAPNPINPCVSDAVTIKYSEKFGRHLVATRKIDPGELLILEKPYCSRLNYKQLLTHCSQCLRKSWSMIPCKDCVNVAYCSETCRDQAWDECHEIECPAQKLILDYKTRPLLCLSMRMAIMATRKGTKLNSLREEFKYVDLNTDPCTKGFTDDGKFLSNEHRSVYSLTGTVDECNIQAVFGKSLSVAMVVCILAQKTTMFREKLTLDHTLLRNPDVIFVGELILKLQDISGSNMMNYGTLAKEINDDYASGIGPFCSLINHSCDPNIVRSWDGTHQVIHAVYPIKKGEQIFDDYGAPFWEKTKSERHKKLRKWTFTCQCVACTENWPMIEDIPSYKKQSLTLKHRNSLTAAILDLEGAIDILTRTKTVESLTDLMESLMQAINTFSPVVQRPCKELTLLTSVLRGYHWAGRALFDYLLKLESDIFFQVLDFDEPVKRLMEHCSTDKMRLVNGLATGVLLAKFTRRRNDGERYRLALEAVALNSSILFHSECKQKDSKHSIKSCADGNLSFTNGEHYEAVQEYTESIVYAVDSSEELALAYAHRSAALFELEKFEECVRDIDRTLCLKFPDRLKSKLYKRKGLCFAKLDRPGAEALFEIALLWVEKSNLSTIERNESRSELVKLISSPNAVAKPPEDAVTFPLPEISTVNSEIPCASDGVAIKYSEKFGRHLVATREIKPGELLIAAKPYCLILSPDHLLTHCSYCLQVSWDLIPCEHCVHVAYCSNACKDKAWDEYHEIECPVVGFLLDYTFKNILWVSVRTVIMATKKGRNLNQFKEDLASMYRHPDPRTKGFSDDGKFHDCQYRSVYSLVDNVDQRTGEDLLVEALFVSLLVCTLASETKMFGEKLTLGRLANNQDVLFIGQLLWKHVHQVAFTTHRFGPSCNEHGDALVAIVGLLNHSCDPNTIRQWYADRIVLYAMYPIKQGEQIFMDYGTCSATTTKSERQEYLDRFQFTCECTACIEDWPKSGNLPSYKTQPLSPENRIVLDKALQEFCARETLMETGERNTETLNKLLKIIELLFHHVQRPCEELSLAAKILEHYYQMPDIMFDYEPGRLSELEEEGACSYKDLQRSVFSSFSDDMLSIIFPDSP